MAGLAVADVFPNPISTVKAYSSTHPARHYTQSKLFVIHLFSKSFFSLLKIPDYNGPGHLEQINFQIQIGAGSFSLDVSVKLNLT